MYAKVLPQNRKSHTRQKGTHQHIYVWTRIRTLTCRCSFRFTQNLLNLKVICCLLKKYRHDTQPWFRNSLYKVLLFFRFAAVIWCMWDFANTYYDRHLEFFQSIFLGATHIRTKKNKYIHNKSNYRIFDGRDRFNGWTRRETSERTKNNNDNQSEQYVNPWRSHWQRNTRALLISSKHRWIERDSS